MRLTSLTLAALALLAPLGARAQRPDADAADSIKFRYPSTARLEALKAEASREIDAKAKMIQVMVDQVFSYGELGFQEVETSKYLTGLLEENGFAVQRGVAGIPTAFVARWGSGKPVISLGSDIDDIPQAGQKPGVGYRDPIVAGAPGHGEGHNSGHAAQRRRRPIVVKEIMQREKLPGTLVLWPGVAEEQMAGKAFLVRAGVFKDVDVTLFTHVRQAPRGVVGPVAQQRAHLGHLQVQGIERARGRARRGAARARSTRWSLMALGLGAYAASTWSSRSARTT
jgi:aminobenzoyl-glutamate utilization protein B